jgi:hypothetical protein
LQLYNQYGQRFDQGNLTVNAGQTLNLQTPLTPATHNIAIIAATSTKTVIGKGFDDNVSVLVADNSDYAETFNVSTYANSTVIGTKQVSLSATDQTTLTFEWNTSSFAYGNYTLSEYAWPIPGQTDTADNNFTGRMAIVTIPGDLNGDFKVDKADLEILTQAYGSRIGDGRWNANADINGSGKIGLSDLVLMAIHYSQQYP